LVVPEFEKLRRDGFSRATQVGRVARAATGVGFAGHTVVWQATDAVDRSLRERSRARR
jgi:hypothetical protein